MKPNVIAVVAVTIDGKIARHAGHFTDWTSPEDRTFLRSLLDKSDAVVIGHNTYKTAAGPLSKRNCIVFTRAVQDTKRQSDNLLYCNPAGKVSVETVLKSYQTVALLGGMQTYTYFLEHGLINELYLTIEPIVFGAGLNIFESKIEAIINFRLASVRELNQQGTLLLHYQRPL